LEDQHLTTLEVFISSGPIAESFAKKNPVISRTIQIRGNQTLVQLHQAIFRAFDRKEDNMYEFQFGGKGPMDLQARRYVFPGAMDPFSARKPAGDVAATSLGSLGLKAGAIFGYWFDFGDDWWHQINVVSVLEQVQPGKYPKVVQKVGASPPQ